jgi:hypothetical protein
MKLKRLFIVNVFFIMAFSSIMIGQEPRLIILNVDTESITPSSVKENSYFEGQAPGDSPGSFVTVARVWETLQWEGRSLNGTDEIYIKRIQRVGGPNIFEFEEIDSPAGERFVRATIVEPTGRSDNGNIRYFRYHIQFRINDPDTGTVYLLDPLIRSHN